MSFIKTVLHRLDPERIHELALFCASAAGSSKRFVNGLHSFYRYDDERLQVSIGNLTFPNPIGLAAGFDKNGVIVPVLQALGFGFIEIGTVTPFAQPGNPKPRLFRLRRDSAIINRMGFNNEGLDSLCRTFSRFTDTVPVGINLGKNKTTPVDQAVEDYRKGIRQCWNLADYFTINISSPNTEGLRDLQQKDHLSPLVEELIKTREILTGETGAYKQLWLKIAPDLTDTELETICDIVMKMGIDAMVLTNTTISRPPLQGRDRGEQGGLSGKPLFQLSNSLLRKVYALTDGKIPLVGVGGVFGFDDVLEKIGLGASLVQLYTGLVYEGPGLIRQIKQKLAIYLDKQGESTIIERIGCKAQK